MECFLCDTSFVPCFYENFIINTLPTENLEINKGPFGSVYVSSHEFNSLSGQIFML